MKVSQVLFKAAKIIERDGWNQGWYINDQGCVCAYGAIRKAICNDATDYVGHVEARIFCEFLQIETIAEWNDAPERTVEEVIDALVIASVEAA